LGDIGAAAGIRNDFAGASSRLVLIEDDFAAFALLLFFLLLENLDIQSGSVA
jgi:hypothetical protein